MEIKGKIKSVGVKRKTDKGVETTIADVRIEVVGAIDAQKFLALSGENAQVDLTKLQLSIGE